MLVKDQDIVGVLGIGGSESEIGSSGARVNIEGTYARAIRNIDIAPRFRRCGGWRDGGGIVDGIDKVDLIPREVIESRIRTVTDSNVISLHGVFSIEQKVIELVDFEVVGKLDSIAQITYQVK